MKKLALVVCLLTLLAVPAFAQEEVPRYEIFAGYSYLRGDVGERHGDLTGGAIVSGAYNFNKWFSGVAEWSTHHDTFRGTNVDSNLFLFGPRATFFRHKRFSAYGQGLFGLHNTQVGFPGVGAGNDDTGFAFAGGVGGDIQLTRNWSVRAIQVDYLTQDLNLPTRSGGVANQFTDNIRLSSGIVYRWGGR